jgi:hypothetical protein
MNYICGKGILALKSSNANTLCTYMFVLLIVTIVIATKVIMLIRGAQWLRELLTSVILGLNILISCSKLCVSTIFTLCSTVQRGVGSGISQFLELNHFMLKTNSDICDCFVFA